MENKKAMNALSYGLFILSTQHGGKDNGCIINTAMQVTEEPLRILFTVNNGNYTADLLRQSGRFTLSVLSEGAGFDLFRRFGFQSGREADKFAGLDSAVRRGDNGTLQVVQGTNAWISGTVYSTQDLGSHTLFLADVTGGDVLSPEASATYAFYHAHIKPAPAAPAAEKPGGKKRWVCKVCGYVYEGDELPADFICPWCKHPAGDFELMA